MWRVLKENLRLRKRVLDLAGRLEEVEADVARVDLGMRKLRGAVTGGQRTAEPEETQPLGDATFEALNQRILQGEVM